jgi:hypothetical protein
LIMRYYMTVSRITRAFDVGSRKLALVSIVGRERGREGGRGRCLGAGEIIDDCGAQQLPGERYRSG